MDLSKAISLKRCKIGGNLVLVTNRKSICTKSVTFNDLEWRNGPYFALFHRIRVHCRGERIIRPTSVFKSTFDSL